MNSITFRKTLLSVGVAIALGVGTAACSDRSSSSEPRTQSENARTSNSDTAVTDSVKTRLTSQDSDRSSNIQVSTNDGVVTLEGTVSSDFDKSEAEALANSVDGVDRVDNRLVVSSRATGRTERSRAGSDDTSRMASDEGRGPGSDETSRMASNEAAGADSDEASDTWITTQVKSLLLADSVSQGLDITVETKDGVVSLEGALDDEDTIDHVREIAEDVEGVRDVDTARLVVATRN